MAEANDAEKEIEAFTREIDKAKKMRWALVKLKHRLETKLKIPCAATFKEYESFGKVDQLKNNYTSVALASCRAKLELCLIAGGIKCVDIKNGKMLLFELCFSVGPRIFSGYLIQIEVENEDFRLAKYNLPDGLDVKTIIQKVPMKGTDDMLMFLNFVHACSCALLHRRNQVEELKKYCAYKGVDIDVFTSSDLTYIDISFQSDTLKLTSKTEKISFILRYDIDTYLPISTVYEKEHMKQEDKSPLDSCCLDFLTLSLVEAFRCVKHVKRQPQESTSKQLKQGTLQFHTMAPNSKLIKDPAMHRRTQERTTPESKSLEIAETLSGHTSVHTQKFSEDNVESMPETTSPRHISSHAKKPDEKVESRRKTASPRRKLIRGKIFSDDDESMRETTSPRPLSTRGQKMPEDKDESRSKTASPRRKLIRGQIFSDDDDDDDDDDVSMPETASPKRVSTHTQKMPREKVELRTKTTSPRRTSIHMQKFSDNVESMPEATSSRHISTRGQKMPEDKVESRSKTASPRRSIRLQKFSDDDESMPEIISPKRVSNRTQKMPVEKVESRTKTVSSRHKSIHGQNFSDDVDNESMPETASPRRVSTRTQRMPEENVSITKNASPKRTSQDKQLSGDNGFELRHKSSPKQVPVLTQQMPKKTAVVVIKPMVWIPEDTRDNLKRNPQQRQFSSQKSSTPVRTGITAQEQQLGDMEIDDLSTIMGSGTSLSEGTDPGYPVAASTPFVPSNLRQKRIIVAEKQNTDHSQTASPQMHSHKYRQTQLHQFIKNQPAQEISTFIRRSPRKKSYPGGHFSQSDEDENEHTEMEKEKKSVFNVHKSTPVPKGFQTSRMKKSGMRHSVVTGKRLRKRK